MPVYQYACTECGEQLEVRQSFTDSSLTECPVCEGRLRKVLNAVGVVFKGSGFYRNDSRAAATSDSGPARKTESASEGASKSDSSPKSDGSAKSESSSTSAGSSKNGSKAAAADSSSGSGGSKPAPAPAH